MSIINKMHQGLKDDGNHSPILAAMPQKTHKKKVLLLLLTFLLLLTSIGLSYLIYEKQNNTALIKNNVLNSNVLKSNVLNNNVLNDNALNDNVLNENDVSQVFAKKAPIVEHKTPPSDDIQKDKNNLVTHSIKVEKVTQPDEPMTVLPTQTINSSNTQSTRIASIKTNIINMTNRKNASSEDQDPVRVFETVMDFKVIQPTKPIETVQQPAKIRPVKEAIVDNEVEARQIATNKSNNIPNVISKAIPKPEPVKVAKAPLPKQANKVLNTESSQPKQSFLQVTRSSLTDEERANIHLKKATQALAKDNARLAAQEKNLALELKPDLHDIRTSLALYYYGAGEEQRATTVLKKGVLQFPEYADFSLMLSRIAIKKGDQQKAYLYLNQHPPEVKGNLDYHVNYAILAQKFKQYAQSESLYRGLLTQRPDNGRWMMSLAIAQDKQGKTDLAMTNYQNALMKIDLSDKAKQYINQRLLYLKSQ